MGETSSVNHENAFIPSYIKDQEAVLDQIKVKPIEQLKEVNPILETIYKFVSLDKTFKYEQGYLIPSIIKGNETIAWADKSENGILTITLTKKSSQNQKLNLIENYCIIDTKNNNFFNVDSLWEKEPFPTFDKYTEAILVSMPGPRDADYIRSGYHGRLLIYKINTTIAKGIGLSSNESRLTEASMIFHGLGHKYKYQYNTSPIPIDELKLSFTALGSKIPLIKEFYSEQTMKSLEDYKKNISERERNAAAFSLSFIRKLKNEGVNLTRDLNNDQILKAVSYGLNFYEGTLNKVNGPKIANPKNKK